MRYSFSFLITTITLFSALFSNQAFARSLWIEGDVLDGLHSKLYFGEYGENQRESSPGELDHIVSPSVSVFDTEGVEKEVTAEKSGNHFVIPSGKTILVQAPNQPVDEIKRDGKSIFVKPYFYARLGTEGSMPLDIKQNGNKLSLYFRNKPLADASIRIIASNGWERRLRTNENGEVTFTLPGLGIYIVEAEYENNQPGEFEGKAYTREIHTATLSIYQ